MNWSRDRHLEIWFKELCQNLSLVPIPDPRAPPDPLSPMLRPAEYFCVHPVDHVGKLIQLKNKQGNNAFFCQVNQIPNLICWAVEKVQLGAEHRTGARMISLEKRTKWTWRHVSWAVSLELQADLGCRGKQGIATALPHPKMRGDSHGAALWADTHLLERPHNK